MAAFAAEYPGMKWLHLDMGEEAQVLAIVQKIIASEGHLGILVNNAVARVALKSWDLGMDTFENSFHVNAAGLARRRNAGFCCVNT